VLAQFSAGLVAGGVLTATALWLLSGLARPVPVALRYGVLVTVAALAVLRDAGLVRLPLPQSSRQIPREVLATGRPGRGALQFGFELGTGVRTYLSASAPYVVAAALLLAGPGPVAAVLAGAGFGAGRAATPLARHAAGAGAGQRWGRRLQAVLPVIVITADLALALLLAAARPAIR
jgi:hypothetical protein